MAITVSPGFPVTDPYGDAPKPAAPEKIDAVPDQGACPDDRFLRLQALTAATAMCKDWHAALSAAEEFHAFLTGKPRVGV